MKRTIAIWNELVETNVAEIIAHASRWKSNQYTTLIGGWKILMTLALVFITDVCLSTDPDLLTEVIAFLATQMEHVRVNGTGYHN